MAKDTNMHDDIMTKYRPTVCCFAHKQILM